MIRRWEDSGMTHKEFAKQENVSFNNFYYWLKRYRFEKKKFQPSHTGKFIKLSNPVPTFSGSVYAEVVFPGGISIRFHQPISSAELKQLAGL